MIRVIYANYNKMDNETRLNITVRNKKPPRDIIRKYYNEVAKFKNTEVGHTKGEDLMTLNYIWNLFNTQAHNYRLRTMCVGDIIEIDTSRYIVTPYGFERLVFPNTRNTRNQGSVAY